VCCVTKTTINHSVDYMTHSNHQPVMEYIERSDRTRMGCYQFLMGCHYLHTDNMCPSEVINLVTADSSCEPPTSSI